MRKRNTDNENEVRFTQELIDQLNIDKPVQIVSEPAFTDANGNLKVIDRKVVTPDGYQPESTDEEILRAEVEHIVKYELSNNIENDVAYLMMYRYTLDEQSNELKVIVHGIY